MAISGNNLTQHQNRRCRKIPIPWHLWLAGLHVKTKDNSRDFSLLVWHRGLDFLRSSLQHTISNNYPVTAYWLRGPMFFLPSPPQWGHPLVMLKNQVRCCQSLYLACFVYRWNEASLRDILVFFFSLAMECSHLIGPPCIPRTCLLKIQGCYVNAH